MRWWRMWWKLWRHAWHLPRHELALLARMAEGAHKGLAFHYGKLNFDLDNRDMIDEAIQEFRDAAFYLGAELERLQEQRTCTTPTKPTAARSSSAQTAD